MKKEELPLAYPELTITDRLLEMAILFTLAGLWLLVIYGYQTLPETIPTHFNLKGEVDGYGPIWMLNFMPILCSVMFPGMIWLSRVPHRFNYLVKITPENALAQYRLAARFIRMLTAFIRLIRAL